MGRSDRYIFNFYRQILKNNDYKKVGYFGQKCDNDLSRWIKTEQKYFYDIQLNNWDINEFPYAINEKFDLIICTRVAYFCKKPLLLIKTFCVNIAIGIVSG